MGIYISLAHQLHGPLHAVMIKRNCYQELDPTLEDDFAGFPLVGIFPPSGPDVVSLRAASAQKCSVEELVERRLGNNTALIDNLRESEWDYDLFDQAMQDAQLGFSTRPQVLSDWHVQNVTVSKCSLASRRQSSPTCGTE